MWTANFIEKLMKIAQKNVLFEKALYFQARYFWYRKKNDATFFSEWSFILEYRVSFFI